jgi:hypothetical protein
LTSSVLITRMTRREFGCLDSRVGVREKRVWPEGCAVLESGRCPTQAMNQNMRTGVTAFAFCSHSILSKDIASTTYKIKIWQGQGEAMTVKSPPMARRRQSSMMWIV